MYNLSRHLSKSLSKHFVTCFNIGNCRIAPGTLGSIVGVFFSYLLIYILINNNIIYHIYGELIIDKLLTVSIYMLLIALILSILAFFAIKHYLTIHPDNLDPKEVVIDEFIGQIITIALSLPFMPIIIQYLIDNNFSINLFGIKLFSFNIFIYEIIFLYLIPFILFRIFDIFKPWPINYIDRNVKGAFGVIIDDILAAIFAFILYYVTISIIL